MIGLFLQTAADFITEGAVPGWVISAWAFLVAMWLISLIFCIVIYIYTALVYMKIAKRTNTTPAWIAWIPVANLYLLNKISGMHWWPIFIIIGSIIPVVNFIAWPILIILLFVWHWKIFKKVGRPGWWSLLMIIPLLNLILLGVAAWGGQDNNPVAIAPITSTTNTMPMQ